MCNKRWAIRIKKTLVRSCCEKQKQKKNRVSQFQQSTWLSSVTTDWSEKIVEASYKLQK